MTSLQQFIEVIIFCILLYLYKKKNVKHIVVVMLLVALLGTHKRKLSLIEGHMSETIFGGQSLLCCLATKENGLMSFYRFI